MEYTLDGLEANLQLKLFCVAYLLAEKSLEKQQNIASFICCLIFLILSVNPRCDHGFLISNEI